jgi:hypothetical protein
MTNTILLAIIAAALAWSCILREPVLSAVRMIRQRRRVIPGAVPVSATPAPDDAASMQLLLCDADGKKVEHEIAVHFTDAPEQYRYAGKTYRQEKRRHTASAHDVIWEYRRLALLLVLLLWSGGAFAQDASVTIRRPDGTEAGTSASPLRVDTTGTTSQPVTQGTAANLLAQVNQRAAVSTSATLQSGATANGNGSLLSVDGMATAVVTVNCATCAGGTTVTFEVTEDGTNFVTRDARRLGADTVSGSLTTAGVTAWEVPVAGFVSLRARISSYSAGTVTVTGHAVPLTPALTLSRVDGSTFTQPISAASLPLPSTAATSTKQSDGSQKTQIVDGAGAVVGSTSNALDVNIKSGGGSGGTSSADGAAYSAGTTAGTPSMGARDDAGTTACAEDKVCIARLTSARALLVDLSATAANATAIKTDGSAVTQPVSASSLPLPTGAATEATLATLLPSATFTGRMPAGASPANGESNTNTALSRIGAFNFVYNGSTWDRWTGAVSQGTAAAASGRWPMFITDLTNFMPTMDAAARAGFQKITDGTNTMPTADAAARALFVKETDGTNTQPTGDASARAIYVQNPDPCFANAKTFVTINISTATTTQLVAASASNSNYICSLNLVAGAADNVALIEDDTAACASPTAGMAGGTTAASGWNFAANGGLVAGTGQGTVFKTAATNRYTCLVTSAATQLSGSMSYVQVP